MLFAGLNCLDLLQRHVAAGERHELFPAAAGAGEVVDVGLKLRAAVEAAGAPRLGLDAQRHAVILRPSVTATQQSVRKCGMTPESVPTRTVMLRTPSSASSREMSRTILSSASHSASSCITYEPPS